MDPQTILLIVYGLSQAAQAIVEILRNQANMTPEELQAAWDAQRTNLAHAIDLWNKQSSSQGKESK